MKHIHNISVYCLGALIFILPALAAAQDVYTARAVNVRAGPDRSYPLVAQLPAGTPLQMMGCLDDWSWCDVLFFGDSRGWIYAPSLSYSYQGGYVPLYPYAPSLGIPIIAFSLGPYWDDYYRGRPWYQNRHEWVDRRIPRSRPSGPPPQLTPPPSRQFSSPRLDRRSNDLRTEPNRSSPQNFPPEFNRSIPATRNAQPQPQRPSQENRRSPGGFERPATIAPQPQAPALPRAAPAPRSSMPQQLDRENRSDSRGRFERPESSATLPRAAVPQQLAPPPINRSMPAPQAAVPPQPDGMNRGGAPGSVQRPDANRPNPAPRGGGERRGENNR
jgi:uncharacterized protein YraI